MKQKLLYAALIILIVIIAGLGIIIYQRNNSAAQLHNNLDQGVTLKTEHISGKNDVLTWDAEYPVTGNAAIDKNIQDFVNGQIDQFKKDNGNPDPQLLQFLAGRKFSLEIGFTQYLYSKNLLSLLFVVYQDTGGAHPNTYLFTKNYDLRARKEFTIKDFFKNNSDYLRTLSDLSTTQLEQTLAAAAKQPLDDFGIQMLKDGTSAKEENFQNFNLTEKNLVIQFNDYQVAPHVFGPQQVQIPYQTLKTLINSYYLSKLPVE